MRTDCLPEFINNVIYLLENGPLVNSKTRKYFDFEFLLLHQRIITPTIGYHKGGETLPHASESCHSDPGTGGLPRLTTGEESAR